MRIWYPVRRAYPRQNSGWSQGWSSNVYADMAQILKDIMTGIYWLVELRPGASAEIISVCN